jgi:hypothetical protein
MRIRNAYLLRKILPFLVLLLIGFPLFAGAGQLSKFYLVAGKHRIIATIYQEGHGFLENDVLSFRLSASGKLLKTMTSDRFERPVLFRYHGENFVHVSTTPAGSGGFVTDTIFWISPDAAMHEIKVEDAAENYEGKVDPQETVLSGGGMNCNGDKLTFEFYIANDADPHCCPTGGRVTGDYEIVGNRQFDTITNQYSSTFKVVVKQYLRTPIATGEMLANFTK